MVENKDLLLKREAAARCRVSKRTLERWARLGVGPTPLKIGPGGLVRYLAVEVEDWLSRSRVAARAKDAAHRPEASERLGQSG